jgi:hypothetical protein
MKTISLLILFLLACTVNGLGEDVGGLPEQSADGRKWIYRGEVYGSVGWGAFWHGDDSLGRGIDLGVGVGFRPFQGKLRGLGFEFRVNQLQHDIQYSATHSADGKALTLLGNALYHFGDSKIQPYVMGGIGILKADYTWQGYSERYDGGPDGEYHEEYWTERTNASKMAINFGLGLKAVLTKNLSIRPEFTVTDTTPGSGYNWGVLRVSLGVGYHW